MLKSHRKAVFALAALTLLCGCRIQGYHKLERYGNSDRGGWSVSMDNGAYAMIASSAQFNSFMSQARTFSNPSIRSSGGTTYIEDVSGNASMEHAYDDYNCGDDPSSSRYVICEYSTVVRDRDLTGWTVDWTVELDPDMQMLSSNHHRMRVENGRRLYMWYFDGNRDSSFNIWFRVRAPRA